jgi:hypothetical protein
MRLIQLRKSVLSVFSLLFLAVAGPRTARADFDVVNGRLVIPVDDEAALDTDSPDDLAMKGGITVRSAGGQIAQKVQRAVQSGRIVVGGRASSGTESRGTSGESKDDARNVQANDPALDHIVRFNVTPPTRPFEFATQSETSAVRNGRHITVGYNSSADTTVTQIGNALFFTQIKFSGFSTSHDGGRTWSSGFVPAVNDAVAPFTFGDPALAMDRQGNIFYTSLGTDARGVNNALIINESTDHGSSFGSAIVVAVDNGSDKEWLAIGPDPTAPSRDNIYVTWTSFKASSSELWLARSTDGGLTFTSRKLFAPVDDGVNSSFIQFSNPVVDVSTGRLFIPFLHFSDSDADNVRVLVSDDGGVTFRFLAFNVRGAVDAFAFPNVTPGLINDCRGGGRRNALVAGASQGNLRGSPIFKQATRLISQPHAVAARGTFAFVLNSNVSQFFGDDSQGSEINVVVSTNGGRSFTTTRVAASTAADFQHVHPAISLSSDAQKLTVSYYVQQANRQLRTDVATLKIDGGRVRLKKTRPLSSTAFDLTPSNVLRTGTTATTNFDRLIVSCYDIGEYQTLARPQGDDDGTITAAWGDNRQTWISPPDSPAAGTHAQPDVFTAGIDDD